MYAGGARSAEGSAETPFLTLTLTLALRRVSAIDAVPPHTASGSSTRRRASTQPPLTQPRLDPELDRELTDLTPGAIVLGIVLGLVLAGSSVYLPPKVGLTASPSIPMADGAIMGVVPGRPRPGARPVRVSPPRPRAGTPYSVVTARPKTQRAVTLRATLENFDATLCPAAKCMILSQTAVVQGIPKQAQPLPWRGPATRPPSRRAR